MAVQGDGVHQQCISEPRGFPKEVHCSESRDACSLADLPPSGRRAIEHAKSRRFGRASIPRTAGEWLQNVAPPAGRRHAGSRRSHVQRPYTLAHHTASALSARPPFTPSLTFTSRPCLLPDMSAQGATVDIRIELPTYSRSFSVHAGRSSTIRDVKHEITKVCPGSPRADGQRLIHKGRFVHDDEIVGEVWKVCYCCSRALVASHST